MRDDAATALREYEDVPSLPRRRFERSTRPTSAGALALDDYAYDDPRPVTPERTAERRAYGTHRRGERAVAAGYQPGRRTVEITGQAQQPRRRSHTSAAMVARPDRTALWAFLLAVFLVVMAIATAHPGA
jgi:hypothetical protein